MPSENHEFHISRTVLNYNSEEQSLQITMNMFIDDLELALREYGVDSLKICTKKEATEAERYIQQYINDRLMINIDGIKFSPIFLGKEQSEDLLAVWCYLEVENVHTFMEIEIGNNIMVDLYDDQKNMTTVQKDKERIDDILFTPSKIKSVVKIDE